MLLSAFAMGVVKTITIPRDLDRSADFIRTTVLLFIWNACEVNIVIVAGCVPTIMPLVERLRGRDPYRFHADAKQRSGRRRRLLFSKASPYHTTTTASSGSWSYRQQRYSSDKPSLNAPRSSISYGNGDEETGTHRPFQNQANASVNSRDVEMNGEIKVTRQVDIRDSPMDDRDLDLRKYGRI